MLPSVLLFLTATASAAVLPSTTKSAAIPSQTAVIGPLGVEIHPSCNSTNIAQLKAGLQDAEELSLVARQHLLDNGREDPIFQKYFGVNGTTAAVLGIYDRIASSAKPGVVFRCDDIDGQCKHNPTWAGHYRGENATSETVICDNSYLKRLRLTQVCTQGYTVANGNPNLYWAGDILHRLFHVPAVSEDRVEHIADEYDTALELASNGDGAERNSDTLQFFALEVYASRVAAPGVGCLGTFVPTASASSSVVAVTSTATTTAADKPTTTAAAAKECHTHADGAVHCS